MSSATHRLLAALCLLGSSVLMMPAGRAQTQPPGSGMTLAEPLAFPKRKPGLWEVRSTNSHALGLSATRYCIGEKTDHADGHLDRSAGAKGSCTMGAFKRAGSAWVAESVCRDGKVNVTSKAIASGDFESEYRIDTVVTYDPPLAGIKKEDKDAVHATFLGPCLASQRPGDMIIPGMGTLNMVDGTFRAEAAAVTKPVRKKPGT